MRDQLAVISVNSNNLTTLTEELQKGLNDARNNLTTIRNGCRNITSPGDPLSFCDDISTDGLDTQADFTNLPNVTDQLENIEKVIGDDFEKSANDVSS